MDRKMGPHGLILGSTLFLIFNNKIPYSIDVNSKFSNLIVTINYIDIVLSVLEINNSSVIQSRKFVARSMSLLIKYFHAILNYKLNDITANNNETVVTFIECFDFFICTIKYIYYSLFSHVACVMLKRTCISGL